MFFSRLIKSVLENMEIAVCNRLRACSEPWCRPFRRNGDDTWETEMAELMSCERRCHRERLLARETSFRGEQQADELVFPRIPSLEFPRNKYFMLF